MTSLFIGETFRQFAIVDRFMAGDEVSIGDFKRSLFLAERDNDRYKPDRYYSNAFEKGTEDSEQGVKGWGTWRDVVVGTLDGLSSTYLERGGRDHICVRYDRFSDWQHVVAMTSPLAVVSWRLVKEFGPLPFNGSPDRLAQAVKRKILPQIRHSSLPTVHEPRLDRLIAREGLDDLHVHLNGSTEMERVWLDALDDPDSFIKMFRKGQQTSTVAELLSQTEHGLTHDKFSARVRFASRLRKLLIRLTLPALLCPGDPLRRAAVKCRCTSAVGHCCGSDCLDGVSWRLLLDAGMIGVEDEVFRFLPYPPDLACAASLSAWPGLRRGQGHPVVHLLSLPHIQMTPLSAEAVLLAGAYQRLDDEDGEVVAQVLFLYLSLMCLFGRVIVQQRDQIGFDQFQKITLCEVRERLEQATYVDRLRQAEYTSAGDLDVLEGRFAPKGTVAACRKLLGKIDRSYNTYRGRPAHRFVELSGGEPPDKRVTDDGRKVELRLIPHFVKKPDCRSVTHCRHYSLRRNLRLRVRAILNVASQRTGKAPVVGFDGAANEFHAPPEVFAPIFRYIRAQGHQKFTFHAGEDFVHLVSGIRAVTEAFTFLDMGVGNRIGHGTAVGIDPQLWRRRMGASITVRKLEWLDNLVFARYRLMRCGAVAEAIGLDRYIVPLSSGIYGRAVPAEILYRAWRLRNLDPLVALGLDGSESDMLDPFKISEFENVRRIKAEDREAFDVWCLYHSNDIYKKGNALITVGDDLTDTFTIDMLEQLQDDALEELRRRRIVLETLPTSNVRISYYRSHTEHHALRWLGVTGKPANVPVVLGSDDPGIFATNMRNEYCHLLRELDAACPGGPSEALGHVQALIENGKTWRFSSRQDP